MSGWAAIYERLAAPARSLAASLRGYQLSSWRYGPETDRLVEEALEREHWREEQWKTWQEERRARLLHRAATRVPYYREQWSARRRRGDPVSWERLENWPVLSKAPLQENASECPSGAMHLWPDVSMTEWVRDDADQEVPRGHVGRLVCTGLINVDMPLVRYAVGDRAALAETTAPCACGRLLPVIQTLDGRAADLILTPSGSPVGGLDTVFHSGLPRLEAQIVQEALHRIRIKVVPAPGFGHRHQEELIRGVQARIGTEVEVEVFVDTVESIPRTSAGKFQLQMSMIAAGRLP